jgi:hypothetical protein
MVIKYDQPIEVSEKLYRIIMTEFAGVVAGRQNNGKYYIKVWVMKYSDMIEQLIKIK